MEPNFEQNKHLAGNTKVMSDQDAKQQIIDQLKDVENVLVTVNRNPTVDELSAALGVTLLINKLGKHATAVFSGDIPPAITFLEPSKTFENTVDSLRDFIIALDKEKADHLRYKVDGDMVKIFITPYRTTITERDLDFSQGDYNVEMVIAIGVQSEDDLDRALSDHGRIMHDAVVASIGPSQLGTINWDDRRTSSYCEMLTALTAELRSDKNLLDEQIATAFLTGIVAATERFSNDHTTSRAMTVAAELMAAGANQQLIASRLAEGSEAGQTTSDGTGSDGQADDQEDKSHFKVDRSEEGELPSAAEPAKDEQGPDGTMAVSHEKRGDLDDVARQTLREQQEEATAKAEQELATSLASTKDAAKPTVEDLQSDLKAAADDLDESIEPPSVEEAVLPAPAAPVAQSDIPTDEPAFGGVLNATSEQAAEDKRREELDDRNKTLLSHDNAQYVGNPPAALPVLNSYGKDSEEEMDDRTDSLGDGTQTSKAAPLQPLSDMTAPAGAPVASPSTDSGQPTLADIDQQNRGASFQDAQAAVAAALGSSPNEPASAPDGDGLPPLPPMPAMPDFSTLPPLTDSDQVELPPVPPSPEDILSGVLSQPATPPVQTPEPAATTDPGQFRIPGQ